MDKLGLGSKDIRDNNSQIIYIAVSGFGTKGPMANLPAFDHVIQGMSGFTDLQSSDENNFELNLFCIEASKEMLNPNGALLIKTFNNSKLKEVVNKFNDVFSTVCVEKPVASKTSSSEVYLLGLIPK